MHKNRVLFYSNLSKMSGSFCVRRQKISADFHGSRPKRGKQTVCAAKGNTA